MILFTTNVIPNETPPSQHPPEVGSPKVGRGGGEGEEAMPHHIQLQRLAVLQVARPQVGGLVGDQSRDPIHHQLRRIVELQAQQPPATRGVAVSCRPHLEFP